MTIDFQSLYLFKILMIALKKIYQTPLAAFSLPEKIIN